MFYISRKIQSIAFFHFSCYNDCTINSNLAENLIFMLTQNKDVISSIIEFVKSTKLKGNVEIDEKSFWWNLENIKLCFYLDIDETSIEYYRCKKNKAIYLGHTHYDTSEVLNLIQDINDKNKILKITVTPLFQTFSVIDRAKKKKSGFFIRRYYSM